MEDDKQKASYIHCALQYIRGKCFMQDRENSVPSENVDKQENNDELEVGCSSEEHLCYIPCSSSLGS